MSCWLSVVPLWALLSHNPHPEHWVRSLVTPSFTLSPQRVFASTFCGRPAVLKERFRKTYRLPALDEKLTTRRTLQVFVRAATGS